MIISASRRTDIPAFYAEWFMNRIRAGYCTVPNPFNRNQVSTVELNPEKVDVIVFWTRNPAPLIPHLSELDKLGFRYYFQYTVMKNPREIDIKAPGCETALNTFRKLSNLVGPERVIWRYDPIVFTRETGVRFHIDTYGKISQALQGFTQRSVISVVDIYYKANKRLRELKKKGMEIIPYNGPPSRNFDVLMRALARSAGEHGMEIVSCAERLDLIRYGIQPGKCVDDEYIERTFGLQVGHKKDPAQREECGCVVSKDIGMYDTCLFECQYCYATQSFERAKANFAEHNPHSPSLIGWYEAAVKANSSQLKLFGGDL